MEFKELEDVKNVDSLLSIVKSYSRTTEQLKPARKQLQQELSEANDNRLIIAGFNDDTIVAMIQLVLKNADNNPDLANGNDIAHIHNLQVRNDLQSQGIGRKMMAFTESKARQLGKKVLTLGVDDRNKRAIKFYDKLGYEVFGEVEGHVPEELCYLMRKML